MTSKYQKAFTLVELIVVITILAILATIGFISLLGYQVSARDSTRISDVKLLEKKLRLYQVETPQFPLPDKLVTLTTSGSTVGYQGEIGTGVLVDIRQAGDIVDPLTKERYTYSLNVNQNAFQILALMEDSGLASLKTPPLVTNSYASNADKYPRMFTDAFDGRGVIILNDENIPLQDFETGSFELKTNTHTLKLIFSDGESLTASGYTAGALANTRLGISNPSLSCPEGFISVPGNPEFSTEDFCVAQYEMSYFDADTPNSCNSENPSPCSSSLDWNSVRYEAGKVITSIPGKYPIANISQQESIDACKSMGVGYHLVTNDEWMTIVRNIESRFGEGLLFNGVSNNVAFGCNATGGNSEPRTYATKTGPGNDTSCNSRRKNELSNGSIVWDMAGNVWEHVNKANNISGSGAISGSTVIVGTSSNTGWDNDGVYNSGNDMRRYGSLFGLGVSQGRGNIYYIQSFVNTIFLRGGAAQLASDTGPYSLFITHPAGGTGRTVGFRCAK